MNPAINTIAYNTGKLIGTGLAHYGAYKLRQHLLTKAKNMTGITKLQARVRGFLQRKAYKSGRAIQVLRDRFAPAVAHKMFIRRKNKAKFTALNMRNTQRVIEIPAKKSFLQLPRKTIVVKASNPYYFSNPYTGRVMATPSQVKLGKALRASGFYRRARIVANYLKSRRRAATTRSFNK